MRISAGQTVRLAMDAVWAHRLRSGLTVLGIVIGITTVVTVASLLTGLRKGIVDFFKEFGPDNIFITRVSGDPSGRGARPSELKRRPLDPDMAPLLKRLSVAVEDVGVSLFIPGVIRGQVLTVKVPGFETDNMSLTGLTANAYELSPRELLTGRLFTPDEANRGARVAVLGANIAEGLFPDGQGVGKTFSADGAEYTVVGIFAPAKGGFFGENGQDRQISIPLRTAHERYPQLNAYFFTVKARPGMRDQAYDEARSMLRKLRHVPPGDPDDFSMSTADQIIQSFDNITGMVLLMSMAISGLGLLVGGIGVMNIMLVSVTERTREIGTRKAVGARRSDIVLQFLMEAVALTGFGGVTGVLFAIVVTVVISKVFPSLPSEVPAWAVATGFGVSVMVGVFFGVWPAVKASRLDPVEALRHE
jgi:putative ABC transport system permease protein